jgi:hypothetical protein
MPDVVLYVGWTLEEDVWRGREKRTVNINITTALQDSGVHIFERGRIQSRYIKDSDDHETKLVVYKIGLVVFSVMQRQYGDKCLNANFGHQKEIHHNHVK